MQQMPEPGGWHCVRCHDNLDGVSVAASQTPPDLISSLPPAARPRHVSLPSPLHGP